MKRYKFSSKNNHLKMEMDIYSPRDIAKMVKVKLKKRKKQDKKLFSFKIEKGRK